MAGETGGSILDELKAGSVISAPDGEALDEPISLAPVTPGSPGAAAADHRDDSGDDPFEDEFEPEPVRRDSGNARAARPAVPERDDTGDGRASDGRSAPEANRKRGETRRLNARISQTVNFAETVLIGIHSIIATVASNPSWELDEEEAKKLAEAVGVVQAQYGLELDPKTQAWLHLLGVAGKIYGQRIGLAMMLRAAEKQRAKELRNTPARDEPPRAPEVPRGNGMDLNGQRPGFGRAPGAEMLTNPSQIYPPGHGGANS